MKNQTVLSSETKSRDPLILCESSLKDIAAKLQTPQYSRQSVGEAVIHLGVGGFHRAHQALYLDELLDKGHDSRWGICGVGIMPQDEPMNLALASQDCLYTLVERSGTTDHVRVVGAIKRHLLAPKNPEAVFLALANPQTLIVSLTATEGGYCINEKTGALDEHHPGIEQDLRRPLAPTTIFGYLAEGLRRRRAAKLAPLTIVSCDNIQGNGSITKKMLTEFCDLKDSNLARWIEKNVSFPNSMVDRITPQTTNYERLLVRETFGIEDHCPVVCEAFRQWVLEDNFSQERPCFEDVGVQMVSNVAPYEKMKLRLLNASHSAMGYLGYLAGHRTIDSVARDPEFSAYILALMDEEVTELLDPVPGVALSEYKRTLLSRFSNKDIADQVLRICSDGSGKMPKFILPSIAEQLERGGPTSRLTLCVAAWIRFLSGKDEEGSAIPLQDPLAATLQTAALRARTDISEILGITTIFGDLGQSKRFVGELTESLNSLYEKGARATLRHLVGDSFLSAI
jgi:mannitol 2-dehydrogenase